MNIIFNVSSHLLPQFPSTSSCTKSWSQSLLLIVVASFNSSLSHCCLIFTNFYFNFQNRTYTETLLHCEVHEFFFPTSPYSPKIDSEQESYVHFIPALQSEFQNAQHPKFLSYLLVRVFKFIDLRYIGMGISWSF